MRISHGSQDDGVQVLLTLVRMGMGTEKNAPEVLGPRAGEDCGDVWRKISDMAYEQGVTAIAFDGLQKWMDDFPDGFCALNDARMSELKFRWLSNMMYVEDVYAGQQKFIGRLSSLFRESGLDMMVMKGYGLSLDYPVPAHRPPGDVDVYHFGKWKEADGIIAGRGVRLNYGHHHHSVYHIGGQMVENHYDIINRYAHKGNDVLDNLLKKMASESVRRVPVGDGIICLPSADFNALFLLKHAGAHFAAESINLKHILDWGTFMVGHSGEVDWPRILPEIRRTGCRKFFCALNGLCIDVLGFPQDAFPEFERMESLQKKMLEDVFFPWGDRKDGEVEGFCFRMRRWTANRWKHRVVYEWENPAMMFLRQGWSHLLNPSEVAKRKMSE